MLQEKVASGATRAGQKLRGARVDCPTMTTACLLAFVCVGALSIHFKSDQRGAGPARTSHTILKLPTRSALDAPRSKKIKYFGNQPCTGSAIDRYSRAIASEAGKRATLTCGPE